VNGPGTFNIASYSEDWRSRLLSTFAHTPFRLQCGERVLDLASVEGFWQGLKWPEASAERLRIFGLWGIDAKMAGHGAPARTHVRFCGCDVPIGSAEHHELARLAIKAKLEQNKEVQRALEATDDLRLTHVLVDDNGQLVPDSLTLPAAVFCRIWTELRAEWRSAHATA